MYHELPATMGAMILEAPRTPLIYKIVPRPKPTSQQVLVRVIACGICRTDLHIIDGDLKHPKLPLILGHEIIGKVVQTGKKVKKLKEGDIVGVPWLGYTCGTCKYCQNDHENLCDHPLFTGYTLNGGFAEYCTAYEAYSFKLPSLFSNPYGAPLMCAGLIGYRSYNMIKAEAQNIGIYGVGAAAHILIQVAIFEGKKIYAFTRKDDRESQEFAMKLGAEWVGDSTQLPPLKLDAAIIFAPLGYLIPKALSATDKGGTIVCGGIHMTDIPSFSYDILWEERSIRSVANLTRKDAGMFLKLATKAALKTEVHLFKLYEVNEAISEMRAGNIHGAAVLEM